MTLLWTGLGLNIEGDLTVANVTSRTRRPRTTLCKVFVLLQHPL